MEIPKHAGNSYFLVSFERIHRKISKLIGKMPHLSMGYIKTQGN
jgi:hypothetical protein